MKKTCTLFAILLMTFSFLEAQKSRKVAFETNKLFGKGNLVYPFANFESVSRTQYQNAKINGITVFENTTINDTLSDGIQGNGVTYKTDNTVACSSIDTTDYVVALRNSRILFYRFTPNTIAFGTDSLEGFMFTPLPAGWLFKSVLDPRIIYDAVNERYIMTFLAIKRGIMSGNQVVNDSRLQIYVSTTSNPLDPWYEYIIEDEDVTDNAWYIDYPILGQSIEEVFLTANIYPKNSINETFQDNLVLVFPKDSIYNGIKALTNLNILNSTDTLFSMYPVSSGEFGNYGPGIYLIHTNSDGYQGLDSLWVYNIDNDVNTGAFNIFVTSISLNDYQPTKSLKQLNSPIEIFSTGCRITGAFALGNNIHYVFNTKGTLYASQISYNRLNTTNWQNTEYRYGATSIYPSLSSFANNPNNNSALIAYQSSDSLTYPSFHVVTCDSLGDWGNDINVAAGQRANDYGLLGDYTGACRNYTKALPTSWIYGCYMPTNLNFNYFNHLSEIIYTFSNGILMPFEKQPIKISPNPIRETFHIDFDKGRFDYVEISIMDIQGKEVQTIYKGSVQMLPNSFSKPQISGGIYFIQIIDNQKQTIGYEKVIID